LEPNNNTTIPTLHIFAASNTQYTIYCNSIAILLSSNILLLRVLLLAICYLCLAFKCNLPHLPSFRHNALASEDTDPTSSSSDALSKWRARSIVDDLLDESCIRPQIHVVFEKQQHVQGCGFHLEPLIHQIYYLPINLVCIAHSYAIVML
jgi:hypothetical protein